MQPSSHNFAEPVIDTATDEGTTKFVPVCTWASKMVHITLQNNHEIQPCRFYGQMTTTHLNGTFPAPEAWTGLN